MLERKNDIEDLLAHSPLWYLIYTIISWLSQFLLSFQVELINKFTSLKFIYTI